MLLNKTTIKVHPGIKKLLKKYKLGVMFLQNKQFQFMLDSWGLIPETIAATMMHAGIIIVNAERVKKSALTQNEINYLLLHEIAHVGRGYYGEREAHKSALGFARYYNIKINHQNVIIE